MTQAVSSFRKIFLTMASLLLCSCAVMSQPAPEPVPTSDGKAMAERFVRPSNGMAAIVFNEKGQPIVVTREGKVVPPCQICSPELEKRYGPKCAKARQIETSSSEGKTSTQADPSAPLICTKLMNTNVTDVKPISAIRHTGSDCMTVFFNADGQSLSFEFCWN